LSRRSEGFKNAVAYTDPLTVTVAVLEMPDTVNVPALAVIEPSATNDVLKVTVDVLAMPFTVNVPALAVIEPR